jgi:hypothetical protein
VHSMGIFGYGGVIANDNPSVDIALTYDRKAWGCLLLKAADIYDLHSHYNFSLALLYKHIRPMKKLTITPYAGFAIGQRTSLCDNETDGMIILVTSLKLNKNFTLEHCGRFSNTFLKTEYFDWLNRLKVLYSHNHIDFTATGWHNNNVFEKSSYSTIGFSAGYSRIKISERVLLSTTLTAMVITHTSWEKSESDKNGLVFTVAAMVD